MRAAGLSSTPVCFSYNLKYVACLLCVLRKIPIVESFGADCYLTLSQALSKWVVVLF